MKDCLTHNLSSGRSLVVAVKQATAAIGRVRPWFLPLGWIRGLRPAFVVEVCSSAVLSRAGMVFRYAIKVVQTTAGRGDTRGPHRWCFCFLDDDS